MKAALAGAALLVCLAGCGSTDVDRVEELWNDPAYRERACATMATVNESLDGEAILRDVAAEAGVSPAAQSRLVSLLRSC